MSSLKNDRSEKLLPLVKSEEGMSMFAAIDFYDKKYSMKIHVSTYPHFEYVLIVFGKIFNRMYVFFPSMVLVYLAYVHALTLNSLLHVDIRKGKDD
jgi:hypothetical protein